MTFIFIALCLNLFVTGGLIVVIDKQKSQLDAARAKLARIAATDDEIICVLEASESPLAKKLLAVVQEKDKPQLPPTQTLDAVFFCSGDQIRALIKDLRALDYDNYRVDLLKVWVKEIDAKDFRIVSDQRSAIAAVFEYDNYRMDAHNLLSPVVRL